MRSGSSKVGVTGDDLHTKWPWSCVSRRDLSRTLVSACPSYVEGAAPGRPGSPNPTEFHPLATELGLTGWLDCTMSKTIIAYRVWVYAWCSHWCRLLWWEQNLIWPANLFGFAADSVIIENSQARCFLLLKFIGPSDVEIVIKCGSRRIRLQS